MKFFDGEGCLPIVIKFTFVSRNQFFPAADTNCRCGRFRGGTGTAGVHIFKDIPGKLFGAYILRR